MLHPPVSKPSTPPADTGDVQPTRSSPSAVSFRGTSKLTRRIGYGDNASAFPESEIDPLRRSWCDFKMLGCDMMIFDLLTPNLLKCSVPDVERHLGAIDSGGA